MSKTRCQNLRHFGAGKITQKAKHQHQTSAKGESMKKFLPQKLLAKKPSLKKFSWQKLSSKKPSLQKLFGAFLSSSIFALFFGATSLSAAAGDDVIKLLESKLNRTFSLVKFEQLNDTKMFLAVVQDKSNGYRTLLLTDDKQKNVAVVPMFFSSDKTNAERINKEIADIESYNFRVQNSAKLNELFASIPKDYAITIQGASDKITYIVSDPMCPHCQDELANIESRLEKSTIVMIPVGLLGQASMDKAAEIQAKIKGAKTPKEQIQVLREIYARTHSPSAQSQEYSAKVINVTNKIQSSNLIEAVPFIYEAVK
ncbi:hypothetical protein BKN38_03315 [Helicobacter sp. CLO-3]|nr:hypothetical protein BA723_02030 [Helicobacter sp. CLO-3]OHU84180.1 hypothetical protein BKN38_03315 [Helicobacter sp. CLO-3]